MPVSRRTGRPRTARGSANRPGRNNVKCVPVCHAQSAPLLLKRSALCKCRAHAQLSCSRNFVCSRPPRPALCAARRLILVSALAKSTSNCSSARSLPNKRPPHPFSPNSRRERPPPQRQQPDRTQPRQQHPFEYPHLSNPQVSKPFDKRPHHPPRTHTHTRTRTRACIQDTGSAARSRPQDMSLDHRLQACKKVP